MFSRFGPTQERPNPVTKFYLFCRRKLHQKAFTEKRAGCHIIDHESNAIFQMPSLARSDKGQWDLIVLCFFVFLPGKRLVKSRGGGSAVPKKTIAPRFSERGFEWWLGANTEGRPGGGFPKCEAAGCVPAPGS
jgi:hypothetical protein